MLTHPGAAPELDVNDRVLYNGLRICMGVHVGEPERIRDPTSSRYEYAGEPVTLTARITALANIGQILLSGAAFDKVHSTKLAMEDKRLNSRGTFGLAEGTRLYELKARGLEADSSPTRPQGILSDTSDDGAGKAKDDGGKVDGGKEDGGKEDGGKVDGGKVDGGKDLLTQAGALPEDLKMTSDNLNVIAFLGACVQRPNLAIVTEFIEQGSLKSILEDANVEPWPIIHRHIKPSNLLVDESWNVKVADFGLSCIEEENATTTRCGKPCWTAPEIIRGEKYSEKADVYSFGIVMWEMLTREQPYAGSNFVGVSVDVMEGKRPPIPSDCPAEYETIMKKCWHNESEKRPRMRDVVHSLDSLLSEHGRNNWVGI